MSGQVARNSQPSGLRVRVLPGGDGEPVEVFEIVGVAGAVILARSPLLFEVGEDLQVRIEHAGRVVDAAVRVRGHAGPPEARISELEVTDGAWP